MSCIRANALTYLNSVGPFLADRRYNRHPGRGITTDHLSATISPESSRCCAPVESSSRSDSSSARRSQMEVPFPCQMRRPRIPENENGGPVLSCKPTPYLECQTNSLTYLCVTESAPQRRRRLGLIFLLRILPFRLLRLGLGLLLLLLLLLFIIIIIPLDAGAIEKCHEGLWGQAKFL
jgi:hypothetical protein